MTAKPVVGMVGLGKLGLPLAVSIASRGFKVLGYDVNPNLMKKRQYEWKELGPTLKDDFQSYFDNADLTFLSLRDLLEQADIVFVVVQTPHGPEYEGVTRLPHTRADFDYTYLKEAVKNIAELRKDRQTIVVSSTVLPGTTRRELIPLVPDLCYNPSFPAMGTCCSDFLHPEFILLGGDDCGKVGKVTSFYRDLLGDGNECELARTPIMTVSIESAELAKVTYNTFVTAKLTIINNMMEIAHKIPGCNCDEVSDILQLANRRICSPAYMRCGMADGGHCHPRDNIALSYLAEKLQLSCDLFDSMMHHREWQTEWLAHLFITYGKDKKKLILGKSYKPESNICGGSAAILLANLLKEKKVEFEHYDPYVDESPFIFKSDQPLAVFIATRHKIFQDCVFPANSIILDPFRYLSPQEGVKIVPIGIGR